MIILFACYSDSQVEEAAHSLSLFIARDKLAFASAELDVSLLIESDSITWANVGGPSFFVRFARYCVPPKWVRERMRMETRAAFLLPRTQQSKLHSENGKYIEIQQANQRKESHFPPRVSSSNVEKIDRLVGRRIVRLRSPTKPGRQGGLGKRIGETFLSHTSRFRALIVCLDSKVSAPRFTLARLSF